MPCEDRIDQPGSTFLITAIICSGLNGFTIQPVAPAACPAFFLSS